MEKFKLRGTLQDVKNMRDLLVEHFSFQPASILILADNIQFLGFVYDLSNLFNLWKIAEVAVAGRTGAGWARRRWLGGAVVAGQGCGGWAWRRWLGGAALVKRMCAVAKLGGGALAKRGGRAAVEERRWRESSVACPLPSTAGNNREEREEGARRAEALSLNTVLVTAAGAPWLPHGGRRGERGYSRRCCSRRKQRSEAMPSPNYPQPPSPLPSLLRRSIHRRRNEPRRERDITEACCWRTPPRHPSMAATPPHGTVSIAVLFRQAACRTITSAPTTNHRRAPKVVTWCLLVVEELFPRCCVEREIERNGRRGALPIVSFLPPLPSTPSPSPSGEEKESKGGRDIERGRGWGIFSCCYTS
nr:metacaspase-1 isoform X1 [Ipomoea batatas]